MYKNTGQTITRKGVEGVHMVKDEGSPYRWWVQKVEDDD